jgi:DNA (cytosine-5)-methyltransferase 1
VYEADTAKTLDAINCGYPGCNQGGIAVVERVWAIGNGQVDQTDLHEKPGTLNCMHDQQAVMIAVSEVEPRAVDCRNGTEDEVNGAMQSNSAHSLNGNNVVRTRYIVRRLTPLECERLQGYPDGWTDIGEYTETTGKTKKSSDAARYKALGNSIALPPWKWVMKRISACYERDATLASLFDGIGGFPLIWEQINGKGSCLWASEIEEFPIAVTKKRIG